MLELSNTELRDLLRFLHQSNRSRRFVPRANNIIIYIYKGHPSSMFAISSTDMCRALSSTSN